jgi:hypothetical protein
MKQDQFAKELATEKAKAKANGKLYSETVDSLDTSFKTYHFTTNHSGN